MSTDGAAADGAKRDVIEGDDGYYFLFGGTNRVVEFFCTPVDVLRQQAEKWEGLLRQRRDRLRQCGSDYFHLFAPEKITIYPEKVPGLPPDLTSFSVLIEQRNLASDLCDTLVPVVAYLRGGKANFRIYPRTDSHWTSTGCYRAYQMLCTRLKAEQRSDLFPGSLRTLRYVGDLASKLGVTAAEEHQRSTMPKDARQVWLNDLATARAQGTLAGKLPHVGCMARFVNPSPRADKRRALLFGDSFADYGPGFLTGMLADTFAELMFVWSPGIDWAVVQDFRPDLVISELSERFGRYLPVDGNDVQAMATERLQAAMAAAG